MTFPLRNCLTHSPTGIMLCIALFSFFSFAHAALPVIIAAPDAVEEFAGSRDVKFLFVSNSDKNVYFVDYSEANPSLTLLEGMNGATLVDISPDGKWLTYQTGAGKVIEGYCATACTTSLWIRPFAAASSPVRIAQNCYVPRFVVSAIDTPTIIYSTSVDCPRDSFPPLISSDVMLCFKSGMVLRTKTLDGTVLGETDTLFAGGSYYGGISYDNRYLSTGWPLGENVFMLDLLNSSEGPQLMHRVPRIDTAGQISYTNIEACNMSRSPSRIFTNTMLYYDFGLPVSEYSNPLWGSWKVHSSLFITRMGASWGEPLRCYGLPPDQMVVPKLPESIGKCIALEWFNPEWSNHPYYAVASLQVNRLWKPELVYDESVNKEAVYAINLKDRKVLRLVSTTDTAYAATFNAVYPALWIRVPTDFQEDSTWLADPDSQKNVPVEYAPSFPKAHSFQAKISKNVLRSRTPISSVRIFSASGALIWKATIEGNGRNTVVFPALCPGVYMIRAAATSGEIKAIRWVAKIAGP